MADGGDGNIQAACPKSIVRALFGVFRQIYIAGDCSVYSVVISLSRFHVHCLNGSVFCRVARVWGVNPNILRGRFPESHF